MRHTHLHPGAFGFALLALLVSSDPDPFLEFHSRLNLYVQLHRTLEIATPPRVITRDPAEIMRASDALADAIVAARPHARQGDIFTPVVARAFRARIFEALAGEDTHDLLCELYEGDDFRMMRADVYARDPHCRIPAGLPATLLWALPELPSEIEYRVVGRDLALWDEHAAMIIDFIPSAFPEQSLALATASPERSVACTR